MVGKFVDIAEDMYKTTITSCSKGKERRSNAINIARVIMGHAYSV